MSTETFGGGDGDGGKDDNSRRHHHHLGALTEKLKHGLHKAVHVPEELAHKVTGAKDGSAEKMLQDAISGPVQLRVELPQHPVGFVPSKHGGGDFTTTVVEDHGRDVVPAIPEGEKATDGGKRFDIGRMPKMLVGTRAGLAGYLGSTTDRLVTSDVGADRGGIENMLDDVPTQVSLGIGVGLFSALDADDRYTVINPALATVKLITGQLAGLAATGVQAAVPAPTDLAETARDATELVQTVVEGASELAELIGGHHAAEKAGQVVYQVQFHAGGMPVMDGPFTHSKVELTPEEGVRGSYGAAVAGLADTVLGLIDGLPAELRKK